jgi:anhydro-N-acetylmuramic acid kinase
MNTPDYYIGLISGTSMDGIDATLVSFDGTSVSLLSALEFNYPAELRIRLLHAVRSPKTCTVDIIGELDRQIGECFRDAAIALINKAGADTKNIRAIGSHGQTLRHQPDRPHPFTLQIGDPTIIAAGTGITTVADFRRADVARGGQGAPLAPLFHEFLFRERSEQRVVLNIGGIANITVLPADAANVIGFDTGPGNTLLDAWIGMHRGNSYDKNGAWASKGTPNEELLNRLLADPYFHAAPPKSTGFEYFNLDWLSAAGVGGLAAVDVQATLCMLTAQSIAAAIRSVSPDTSEVYVCGGGIHNLELIRTLESALPEAKFLSTATAGLDPDWVEAAAFAWLAKRTLEGLPGNMPTVTGASKAAILGAIHPA